MTDKARMIRSAGGILLGLTLAGAPAFAGWRVGNGGDALRLAFAKAREHAAYITLRLQPVTMTAGIEPRVKDWLVANSRDLAGKVGALTHEWDMEARPTCAWYDPTTPEKLWFSYPTCRATTDSFDEAVQLLLHEGVHAMGLADEDFADRVALTIVAAWRNGGLDWSPLALGVNAPGGRYSHSAVWTGDEMIVFGGIASADGEPTNEGHRFNPATGQWTAMRTEGAPARYQHVAVWDETARQMIVWGGYELRGDTKVWQNNGAVWNAGTGNWTRLETPFGPRELADLAVDTRGIQGVDWSGEELFVFGGAPVGGVSPGGIYNARTGKWRDIKALGAPVRIAGHSVTWADDRLIVWGGLDQARNRTATGAAYFPAARRWDPLPVSAALKPRDGHVAVYTGQKFLVFGGFLAGSEPFGTGGVLDLTVPGSGWTTVATEAVPGRQGHTAVWTGSELLVYGGRAKAVSSMLRAVSAYNPSSNTWRVVESQKAPVDRQLHSAVWTGTSMIVFGGNNSGAGLLDDGGLFHP